MKISEAGKKLATNPEDLTRTEGLLLRYPDIDAEQRDEVGHFLRRATPIDAGILSTNELAWRKSEAFRAEHPSYFRTSKTERLVIAVMTSTVALVIFLLWNIGIGG